MKKPKVNVRAVQRELMERIQTEGVTAGYEAALAVCQDPDAAAPAKATAAMLMFRAAGYFSPENKKTHKELYEMSHDEIMEQEDERFDAEVAAGLRPPGKPPSQMNADELKKEIEWVERQVREKAKGKKKNQDPSGGVFG